MTSALRAVPSSVTRGEINVQPAYFTSSLFIEPLREDIAALIAVYSEEFYAGWEDPLFKPFALFRDVWIRQGWSWLHLKILEPRGREMFVNVVLRLFLQRVSDTKLVDRVVGLFGLYAFFMSQPSGSVPSVHIVHHVSIPIDVHESMLKLPDQLTERHSVLTPQVHFILRFFQMNDVFLILPPTTDHAENPRSLPREIYRAEPPEQTETETGKKKTGRPSKKMLAYKGRQALNALDKWIDKSAYPMPHSGDDPAGAPEGVRALREEEREDSSPSDQSSKIEREISHILLSQRPMVTLNAYRARKDELVSSLSTSDGDPLTRASGRVVSRLQQIDAMAAERGLEVGTEGGDLSGLGRVERASLQVVDGKRGLLSLLEGSGLQ